MILSITIFYLDKTPLDEKNYLHMGNDDNSSGNNTEVKSILPSAKITIDIPEITIDGDASGIGAQNWTWALNQAWCSGSGTYADPYIIDDLSIIDSDNQGGCLLVKDSNAYFIITNSKFANSTMNAGLKFENITNGIIDNNEFENNSIGVHLSKWHSDPPSTNCTIKNNDFNNCENAIKISDESNNNTVEMNTITNCDYGIFIYKSNNITISANSLTSGGIYLDCSNNYLYDIEIDSTNTVNGRNVYYYKDKIGLLASDFSNAGQIILLNCSYATIDNENLNFATRGITLINSDNNSISNIDASFNIEGGIYLEYSNNNTFSGNNASYNGGNSIFAKQSVLLKFDNNDVDNNDLNGIQLQSCDNCCLSYNSIKNNGGVGIHFDGGSYLNLTHNDIILGGVSVVGGTKEQYESNDIDTTNTVNGKIVYYYKKETNLNNNDFVNAGQIYLFSCNHSILSGINITKVALGFKLGFCVNVSLINCNSSLVETGFTVEGQIWGSFIGNTASNNTNTGFSIENFSGNTYNISVVENTANFNDVGIYVKNCHSSNFTKNIVIGNNRDGINLWYSNINNLSLNEVKNDDYGIRLDYSLMNNVTRNDLNENSKYGLYIRKSDLNTVNYNLLNSNKEYGIYISESTANIINDNDMKKCGLGFYEKYMTSDIYKMTGNIIDQSNMVNSKPLVYYEHKTHLSVGSFSGAGQIVLINCSNFEIGNVNTSLTSTGITIYHSENGTISSSNATNNLFHGIYIYISSNITVEHNTVNNNSLYGLYLYTYSSTYYGEKNNASWNTANYNLKTGIYIYREYDCTLSHNTLKSNRDYGIYLNLGNTNLTNNEFFNCGLGLYESVTPDSIDENKIDTSNKVNGRTLYYYAHKTGLGAGSFAGAGQIVLINCSYMTIRDVNVSRCSNGLTLLYCENNTVTKINSTFNSFNGIWVHHGIRNNFTLNQLKQNKNYGIILDEYSESNSIFMNYLQGNLYNAIDDGNDNSWDNNSIGNYWGDYNGVDENDDGIGDSFYKILGTAESIDKFPIWDDGPEPAAPSPPPPDDDNDDDVATTEESPGLYGIPGYDLSFIVLMISSTFLIVGLYIRKKIGKIY
ncbi:MAG: hypothetical protein GF383_04055 [Candidatus Lokiarchaeota archaeon]|nr:hypothetical protein [Candidatus Lokiarchaeota archaeon]MBD3338899.1 hypothetical protein [Candidatus Lokiarchaeota archaeon]